ncbi:MAG: hypothetical protein HGA96_12550 [Desulfobulbaceae bacterium]|nr:hypothetical protein [Desulfobulbaceae bacterium]
MVIVAQVSFPRSHLTQAVTTYTGLPQLPLGVIKNGPFFRTSDVTVFAFTFYNLPDDDTVGHLDMLRVRFQSFSVIPEFHCELQEWQEFREMLAAWVD